MRNSYRGRTSLYGFLFRNWMQQRCNSALTIQQNKTKQNRQYLHMIQLMLHLIALQLMQCLNDPSWFWRIPTKPCNKKWISIGSIISVEHVHVHWASILCQWTCTYGRMEHASFMWCETYTKSGTKDDIFILLSIQLTKNGETMRFSLRLLLFPLGFLHYSLALSHSALRVYLQGEIWVSFRE